VFEEVAVIGGMGGGEVEAVDSAVEGAEKGVRRS